jgi:NADPH-dependent curcumin reductase
VPVARSTIVQRCRSKEGNNRHVQSEAPQGCLVRVAGWQRDGRLVHKEDVAYGLENAPKALLRLFSGENFGKQLVKVADLVT